MKKNNFKNFKGKKREFLKTNKKEVVDYFPRGGTKEDFTYNTTMIDRGAGAKEAVERKFLKKKRKIDTHALGAMNEQANTMTLNEEEALTNIQMESDIVDKTTSRALIPKFKVGDLVLLCIAEIRKDYMIANYSRNKKAFIHASYSGLSDLEGFNFKKHFEVGQFVCGAVVSPGNDIQLPQGYLNKKILVSIDPKIINTGLNAGNLVVGMDLYGKLVIKGTDDFTVDFCFTDTEEDLVKFSKQMTRSKKNKFDIEEEEDQNSQDDQNSQEDQNSQDDQNSQEEEDFDIEKYTKKTKKRKTEKSATSLIIKLIDNTESPELLRTKLNNSFYFFKLTNIEKLEDKTILTVSLNYSKYKFPIKKCDFKFLRPGFMFKSNQTRELTNGVEVAFGGNIGTIFNDHTKQADGKTSTSSKNLFTRVIHVSVDKNATSLSARRHVVSLHVDDIDKKKAIIGTIQSNVKVEKVLYGNSYAVNICGSEENNDNKDNKDTKPNHINAFLHNSQLENRDQKLDATSEIEKVLIKEYNFFDDRAMLSAKKALTDSDFVSWENLCIGKLVKGKIEEIRPDALIIRLNNYIQGKLPKEHITDYPLTKMPKKFKTGQLVSSRVFAYDPSTKFLVLTTKESLLDEKAILTGDFKCINEGDDLNVIYAGNALFQHSGRVMAKLLNFNKINLKENFKVGKVYQYKVYKVNANNGKIFLTNETEVWQPGVGDYENLLRRNPFLSTISTILNKEEEENTLANEFSVTQGNVYDFQIINSKRLVKLLLKHGVDASALQENVETFTKKFLIAKSLINNHYGFIPHELISDFYCEKVTQVYSKLKTEDSVPLKMLVLYHNPNTRTFFLTPKKSLVENADKIPSFSSLIGDHMYYGFVNKKAKTGLVIQFMDNDKSVIKMKSFSQETSEGNMTDNSSNFLSANFNHLSEGQTVLARHKLDAKSAKKRFDLNVYNSNYRSLAELKEEAIMNINNYLHDLAVVLKNDKNSLTEDKSQLLVNSQIEGKVGIVKEYGVLVKLDTDKANVTGFMKNEHMSAESSQYQIGVSQKFRIIDIDYTDNIVYLTDKPELNNNNKSKSKSETITMSTAHKDYINTEVTLTIELFHDNYISASLQSNPSVKAIIPCNLFNFNFESSNISDLYKIGDSITSKVIDYNALMNKLIVEPPAKLLCKIQSIAKSSNLKSKAVIAPGNIIKGRINGVKGGFIFVYIDKTTLGRIPLSEFKGDVLAVKEMLQSEAASQSQSRVLSNDTTNSYSSCPEALKVKCEILHVETKKDVKICDLTNDIGSGNFVNNDKTISKVLDLTGDIENVGIISRVDIFNKFPIKIDHLAGDKKAQIHFSHIPVENIANIKSVYKIGDKITFYSKEDKNSNELNYSLIPFNKIPKKEQINIELEKVYPVRVLKSITGRGLIVDLSIFNNHTETFVDICEISDDLHPNPLQILKTGTLTLGRVLSFDSKANKYFLSLRSSLVDEESFLLIKSGSTLKFKKHFDSFEKIGDYRNKIMKFGVNSVIEQNLVAIGFITSSSEKGVFIKLAHDVIVRASLRELSDAKTTKPYLLYKQDSLVICRVISIYKPKEDSNSNSAAKMNINVSLRESVVKYNLTLRTKDLALNNFYLCNVMNGTEDKLEICILGSTFTGLLKKKSIRQGSLREVMSALNNKQSITLQIVKLDKNVHPPKIRFSNNNVADVDMSIVINAIGKEQQEKNQVFSELYENVKAINDKYKQDEVSLELKELEKNADKIDYESLIVKKDEDEDEDEEEDKDEEDADLEDIEDIADEEEGEDLLLDHNIKAQFLKGLGFNDTTTTTNKILSEDQMDVDEEAQEIEVEEEEEVDMQVDDENKNIISTSTKTINLKSSKKREKDHLKQELSLRLHEESSDKMSNIQSVEFHEKQILSDPNNSVHWIQYGAYILDKLGLPAARKIFERAITTINISLIKDKLNVWIAYMNLENSYGSQSTFKSVVERALEVNDKKTIYKHLVSIYKFSQKFDLAYEVYKILTKNFFSDFVIWKNYVEFLFEVDAVKQNLTDATLMNKYNNIFNEPKEGLNRALQVLGKSKHVDMLIYYGGLQYKFNYVEEARNTFESVLRNYPKRSDIWIVYIDKEIKHTKNVEKIRSVLEKALTVDFKIKVLKTLIKKYMEFEKDFGTPKSLESVKSLTQKLIMEKMANLQEADAENEEEDGMNAMDEN